MSETRHTPKSGKKEVGFDTYIYGYDPFSGLWVVGKASPYGTIKKDDIIARCVTPEEAKARAEGKE